MHTAPPRPSRCSAASPAADAQPHDAERPRPARRRGLSRVSGVRRRTRRGRRGCARRSRCRPWASSPSAPLSLKAGPAMSRWLHGMPSPTNSLRKMPAVEHAALGAALVRQVGVDRVEARTQLLSAAASATWPRRPSAAASRTRVRKSSSLPMTAAVLASATTCAPVRVAMSTMASGLRLRGQGDAVTEDHAALGVGVEHLDGRAAAHRHDVARALGRGARHVLGQAEVAGDGDGQTELGDGEHGAGDRGRAGHVALHRQHARWPA